MRVGAVAKKNRDKLTNSTGERSEQINRQKLPEALAVRLQAVWSRPGPLIDWCDDAASWMRLFCSEARPYREAFYWEAMAQMVSDYLEPPRDISRKGPDGLPYRHAMPAVSR